MMTMLPASSRFTALPAVRLIFLPLFISLSTQTIRLPAVGYTQAEHLTLRRSWLRSAGYGVMSTASRPLHDDSYHGLESGDSTTSATSFMEGRSLQTRPTKSFKGCDYTDGSWTNIPAYTPSYSTCSFQVAPCPTPAHSSYRWQPKSCSVSKFNASAFLNSLSGKSLLVVGDSISAQLYYGLRCAIQAAGFVTRDDRLNKMEGKTIVMKVNGFNVSALNFRAFLWKDNCVMTTAGQPVAKSWAQLTSLVNVIVFKFGHFYSPTRSSGNCGTYADLNNSVTSLRNYLSTISYPGRALYYSWSPLHASKFLIKTTAGPLSAALYNEMLTLTTYKLFLKLSDDHYTICTASGSKLEYVDITAMSMWRGDVHKKGEGSHWCHAGVIDSWLALLAYTLLP